MEDALLHSLESMPISSFSDLTKENNHRSVLRTIAILYYLYLSNTCKDILDKIKKNILQIPLGSYVACFHMTSTQ